jgi:hypothetical protein
MLNFNTEPYNDDYNEDNKFYRVLFRPAFAVQARELTQLQTILQKQVSRNGDSLYKQGAMVIPGQVSIDTKAQYVKLLPSYGGVNVETFVQNLEGKFVTGSNGIKAQIIKVARATVSDPTTIFVRYTSSATDGTTQTFAPSETVTIDDGTNFPFQVAASSPTGVGSLATVQRGVYYVNGFFTLCADPVTGGAQTIVLDKYSDAPSYRVGLNIVESLIVPEDDETLLDNAQTSYNFAAPGAHRYHIDLILSKLPLDSTDDTNFVELLKVTSGGLNRIVNTTQYNVLEDTLARRTYDEAGNYTVTPFNIDVREARTNDRGSWASSPTTYLIGDIVSNAGNYYTAKNSGTSGTAVPPTHTTGSVYDGSGNTGVQWEYTPKPYFNRGITLDGSDDQLAIGFEPGKAYVQGYEITKVATEYVYIDKCRDSSHQVQVTAALAPQTVGNYVMVEAINGLPPVETFDIVSLYNQFTMQATTNLTGNLTAATNTTAVSGSGTAFTTELVVGSNIYNSSGVYVGTVASITNNTNLVLVANAEVAISATTAKKDGRGTTSGTQVGTARVRFVEWDSGTIGTQTAYYKLGLFDIKMSGTYNFATDVKSVFFNNSAGATTYDFTADIVPVITQLIGSVTASNSTTITGSGTSFQTQLAVGNYVYFGAIGRYRRVTAVNSQTSITVDAAITVTGSTISRITTQILEPQYETTLFRLPYFAVKSATAADGTNRIYYTAYEKFSGTTSSGSGGSCTLTISATSGNMISAAQVDNYQLVDNTTGLTVPISSSNINVTGSSTTFTLSDTYASRSFSIIGAVVKTGSSLTRKSKTLSAPYTVTFTSKAAATASIISLGKADGYRLISVMMDSGTFTAPSGNYTIDIMDRYTFDDGQKSSYYDLAKINLIPSFAPPNAPIQVTFEYFTHGNGDYITVDSYTGIDYKKIPFFGNIPLRDCIDFRPRIDDNGSTFTSASNTGQSCLVPKRGVDFEVDFSYYLARTDKIALDRKGNFFQIKGNPGLPPTDPPDPNLGMLLYTLNLEPYTFTTTSGSVVTKKVENKRYTMRDIGRLESRINTLEYYTSLSLLEQETQSTAILDSTTGLQRYKNGFVVDNFSGHSVGDVSNPDYLCSIDMQNNVLRPFFSMKNVNMIEKVSNNSDRAAANYQLTGQLITLPIIDTPVLVQQPYGSRLENINPFAIFTFLGNVSINPPNDDWFETDRRPDIINNVEGDFNTISTLAQKAGVLGTVWNAWQTQWTGTPVSTGVVQYVGDKRGLGVVGWRDGLASNTDAGTIDAMFGDLSYQGGWAHRAVQAETIATQIGQSRTGVTTSVVAKIDTQLVADRILSTAVIPYIRSRNILVQTTGLKPLTQMYPFFDEQSVDQFCTPATQISLKPSTIVGTFDDHSNVGNAAVGAARQVSGDTQVCLNTGDVITGGTSGATAVIVGKENILDNNVITSVNLYVVNIQGTFQANETITGSISGATAAIKTAPTTAVAGNAIMTDTNGKCQFLFNIPQTDSIRFRCGNRTLTLTDSQTNSVALSKGSAIYEATGVLQTKQATYNAVRNGQIVQNQVTDTQTITQTQQRVVSDTGWYDPLAETFLVSSPGGAFITGVDLFFATKDKSIPVHIEIREVVNGYPGTTILPFSSVSLNPEQVNISTNKVTLPDGSQVPSYDTPTRFTFPSPVYLNDATSYALVVASDSNGYNAWVARMGDQIPGSSRTISQQPYNGVLFKSQNGSTWSADQNEDLMFTIYRAKFDTTVVGNVEFVNDVLPTTYLDPDPFETNTGSAKLKVFHPNHGLTPNSLVTISNTDDTKVHGVTATGAVTTSTGSATVTGHSSAFTTDVGTTTVGQGCVLYTAETTPRYIGVVASVSSDTALTLVSNSAITLATNTAFKVVQPVNGIPATEIYKSQTVSVVVDFDSYIINTTTTAKKYGYGGGSTVAVNGQIAYNTLQPNAQMQTFSETSSLFSMKTTTGTSVNGVEAPYYTDDAFVGVALGDNNYYPSTRLVASQQNENFYLAGNKSVSMLCTMTTTRDTVSPVLDTTRLSLIAVANKVNSPAYTYTNQSGIDDAAFANQNTAIAFTSTGISTSDSTTQAVFLTAKVGAYLTISNVTTHTTNNGTYKVLAVATDGSSITLGGSFVSQSAGDTITITQGNTFVDDIAPYGSSTLSNYVTKKINLNTPANTLKVTVSVNSPTNSNISVYYKLNPVGNATPFNALPYTLLAPDSTLPKVQFGDNTYTDVSFTLNNTSLFDAMQVKLVLTSTNGSEVTSVKDLRVIACT